jgi:predicted GIY-YIG superfamily endonuclease
MTPTPKTIQIFLPGGDPRGIRVAEITTRIVQVIEVPRSLLGDFLKMPESDQVAVYFLFGQSEETGEPRVYIGQTGDLRARLKAHHDKKDFWERAAGEKMAYPAKSEREWLQKLMTAILERSEDCLRQIKSVSKEGRP